MAPDRGRGAVVVIQHLGQGRELAGVHVGGGPGHVAQGRGLERRNQILPLGPGEAQMGAVSLAAVAVLARAIELVVEGWRIPCMRPRS